MGTLFGAIIACSERGELGWIITNEIDDLLVGRVQVLELVPGLVEAITLRHSLQGIARCHNVRLDGIESSTEGKVLI